MRRLLVAALAALAAAGPAGCGGTAPVNASQPVVALSYGQSISGLVAQLAGVQRAADDSVTRKAAEDLWRRTIRTALELPKGIDAVGPVGGALLTAAEEARAAARALQGARTPPDDATAAAHLHRAAEALTAAAGALAPALPRSAGPDLDRMRTALPPS